MNNKKKLFENFGGNAFRVAYPQPIGLKETPDSSEADAFLNKKSQPVNANPSKVRLTLSRKPETSEWLVKVYIDGKYSEDATYYTNDRQDAIDTAKAMKDQYIQNGAVIVGRDGQSVSYP